MFPIISKLQERLDRQKSDGVNRGWTFGWRFSMKDYHPGVDIKPLPGEFDEGKDPPAIYSPWNGVVTDCGFREGGGNFVQIDHDGDYAQTRYCHLTMISPEIRTAYGGGQKIFIRAGDMIGKMGNTGKSFGAHLHFQLAVRMKSGNLIWIDPLQMLERSEKIPNQ